nr:hypothetical protein Iba_chr15bCG1840 [Ipomoea batatas]
MVLSLICLIAFASKPRSVLTRPHLDGMINGVTDIEDTNSIFQSHTENQNAELAWKLEYLISSPESVKVTHNVQTDVLLAELLSVSRDFPMPNKFHEKSSRIMTQHTTRKIAIRDGKIPSRNS